MASEPSTLSANEPDPPSEDLIGGRYQIAREIGRGGMGEVFEAHDIELDERVALKLVRAASTDLRAVARLKREVQIARRITHPNVCRTFDFGIHRDRGERVPFITMELVDGESLAAAIRRRGRFSLAQAVPIARQLAAGLDAAHAAGIVHRDFKSANAILSGDRAVVVDFGLSAEPGSPSCGHSLVGSPAYMAPEQIEGLPATAASDVYAFGVVLFEMLTGQKPFEAGSAMATAVERFKRPPRSPRELAPDLDRRAAQAILRCLRIDPSRRFARCTDVVLALRPQSSVRRFFFGAIAMLVVTLASVMSLAAPDRPPPPPIVAAYEVGSAWVPADLVECDAQGAHVRMRDGTTRTAALDEITPYVLHPGDLVVGRFTSGALWHGSVVTIQSSEPPLVRVQWRAGDEDWLRMSDVARVQREWSARSSDGARACQAREVLVRAGTELEAGVLTHCVGAYAVLARPRGGEWRAPIDSITRVALVPGQYVEARWRNNVVYGAELVQVGDRSMTVHWEGEDGSIEDLPLSALSAYLPGTHRLGDSLRCPSST